MTGYFSSFPTINYANNTVVDITRRCGILGSVIANNDNFTPYTIQGNQRPDNIADSIYADPYKSWLVYFSNQIIDPYDWYMDQTTFNNYITAKYGSYELATSKIKYYENNWYEYPDMITVDDYENLDPLLQKYWTAVYTNYEYGPPIGYSRTQVDWTLNTNGIVQYGANGSGFINDEIVTVVFDANNIGSGQVCFANDSTVFLQHISGVVSTGNIVYSSYLYGTESQTNVVFTSSSSMANNISTTESLYWNRVSYYDYETNKNSTKQNINLLSNTYSTIAQNQLGNLLNA